MRSTVTFFLVRRYVVVALAGTIAVGVLVVVDVLPDQLLVVTGLAWAIGGTLDQRRRGATR